MKKDNHEEILIELRGWCLRFTSLLCNCKVRRENWEDIGYVD